MSNRCFSGIVDYKTYINRWNNIFFSCSRVYCWHFQLRMTCSGIKLSSNYEDFSILTSITSLLKYLDYSTDFVNPLAERSECNVDYSFIVQLTVFSLVINTNVPMRMTSSELLMQDMHSWNWEASMSSGLAIFKRLPLPAKVSVQRKLTVFFAAGFLTLPSVLYTLSVYVV